MLESMIFLFLLLVRPSACIVEPSSGREQPTYAPFLANYEIEDSCQYELCGASHLSEFEDGRILPSTCAGKCDALAQKLVTSRFKKEFLWGKCVEMCKERHPREDLSSSVRNMGGHLMGHHHSSGVSSYSNKGVRHNSTSTLMNERAYQERFTCMDDCFSSYERVRPHHKIARACIHAACSPVARAPSETTALECFDRCAHHVSLRVPQSDWPAWSELLSTSSCTPKANQLVLDKLQCTDRKLWEQMSKGVSVSPDVLLLCLNGLCDHDIKCAKSCLGHVSSVISPNDLSNWSRCTYSTVCAKISDYVPRVACSDACLQEHKANERRMLEQKRMEDESARRKEEEARALSAANLGSTSSSNLFRPSRASLFLHILLALILSHSYTHLGIS